MINGSGIAGETVHVQAMSSTLGAGSTPLNTRFDWNFGDGGSKYNNLTGFNAAHIFNNPGTYTITLTLTNANGNTAVATQQVTVAADNRRVIYVDAQGNDANDGSSPASAVSGVSRIEQLLADNVKVEFQRGDTFMYASGIDVSFNNVEFTAYGQGAAPILKGTSMGSDIIAASTNTQNMKVDGLTFDSVFTSDTNQGPPFGVSAAGQNITVVDNTFLNVGYAVTANRAPTGLMVQDNIAPLITGIRGYFVWMQGQDVVILGNTVANVTREHVVRMHDMTRVLVAQNNFTNLDRQSVDPGDYAKGTVVVHNGSYVYVANNNVTGGPIGLGPLGGTDGMKGDYMTQRTSWSVVEGNIFNQTQVVLNHGTENAVVRDNVINRNNGEAITIQGYDSTYQRDVLNVTIDHNTVINNGTQGNFIKLLGVDRNLAVTNNVYVAPNFQVNGYGTAVFSVPSLASFSEIANNIWAPGNRADGEIMCIATYDPTGRKNPTEWNAYSNVDNDQFLNVTLQNGYDVTANGVIAGSRLAA